MTELPVLTAPDKPRIYEFDAGGLAAWCESKGFPGYREKVER